jgi:hypothetical protein
MCVADFTAVQLLLLLSLLLLLYMVQATAMNTLKELSMADEVVQAAHKHAQVW